MAERVKGIHIDDSTFDAMVVDWPGKARARKAGDLERRMYPTGPGGMCRSSAT
jgi:hypothetical protein